MRTIFLWTVLMITSSSGIYAQSDSAAQAAFTKTFARKLRIPLELEDSCMTFFTGIIISVVKDVPYDSLTFQPQCPESFKNAVRAMPIWKNVDWTVLFPDAGGLNRFEVILPFTYINQLNACYGSITDQQIGRKIDQLVAQRSSSEVHIFIFKPYTITAIAKYH